jgi:hypothetical protein
MSPTDSPYRHVYERISNRVSRQVPGCIFDADEVEQVLTAGGTTGTVDGDRLILEEAREYGLPDVPERSPMDDLR